jgi:hypothetical protein
MVPEEYEASRPAMSFAGCAGFFVAKPHKRALGYDHRPAHKAGYARNLKI